MLDGVISTLQAGFLSTMLSSLAKYELKHKQNHLELWRVAHFLRKTRKMYCAGAVMQQALLRKGSVKAA